ncbi:MAG: hypothetical protein JWP74_3029 [Marmoricola sp.]|nr:hypothetical protein [Marmoricola sp.]
MTAPQVGQHVGQEVGQQREGEPRSLGAIVSDISTDLSSLVRAELDLAKVELKKEATTAAKGAGMFGGAGLAGYFAVFFGSLALVYLLDNWMPRELASLIVAVIYGAAAAVLALRGKAKLKESNPQLPETQQTLKEDVQWAKAQKN